MCCNTITRAGFNIQKLPILLLLLVVIAGHPAHGDDIHPFTSDGCSLFPDGYADMRDLWLPCCIEHDKAYWQGGTWQQRLNADRQLKYCVARLGEPLIAELMLNGVRIGGSPFWPTRFRWGYGWDYLRGYKALDNSEKQSVQEALREYEARASRRSRQPTDINKTRRNR